MCYGVLDQISSDYPPVTGRLHTRYAPVRRSPPSVLLPHVLPLDLHVLGLPLAFILSQDQTLHCKKKFIKSWLVSQRHWIQKPWIFLNVFSCFITSKNILFVIHPCDCHAAYLSKRTAKVRTFFELPNFSKTFLKKFFSSTFLRTRVLSLFLESGCKGSDFFESCKRFAKKFSGYFLRIFINSSFFAFYQFCHFLHLTLA